MGWFERWWISDERRARGVQLAVVPVSIGVGHSVELAVFVLLAACLHVAYRFSECEIVINVCPTVMEEPWNAATSLGRPPAGKASTLAASLGRPPAGKAPTQMVTVHV